MSVRTILISAGKIGLFFLIWGCLLAATALPIILSSGPHWLDNLGLRALVEGAGALAAFVSLCIMAVAVYRRGIATIGIEGSLAGAVGPLLGIAIVPLVFRRRRRA